MAYWDDIPIWGTYLALSEVRKRKVSFVYVWYLWLACQDLDYMRSRLGSWDYCLLRESRGRDERMCAQAGKTDDHSVGVSASVFMGS